MDTVERDRMIVEHLPLVGFLVSKTLASATHLSRDDLSQAGAVALVRAVDAYDPERGVPFGAYARERILGGIRDEMRASDWAKRTTRQAIKQTSAATEELTAALGRRPTTDELASALGVDRATAAEYEGLADRRVGPYDEAFVGDEASEAMLPEAELLAAERVEFARAAVQALPERIRYVVEQVYFHDRTVTELAEELGVTHSAVSQQRTEGLRLMRLGAAGYFAAEGEVPLSVPAAPTGRAQRYLEELGGAFGGRTAATLA